METAFPLGRVGVFSSAARVGDLAEARDAAAELEQLGYGTLWIPGRGPDVFERAAALLEATTRIVVATGIVSIWHKTAEEAAAAHHELRQAHGSRFLLGLGVSHAPLVDRDEPGRYRRPVQAMAAYLDALDTAAHPVAPSERILAALAPKMLALARDRAAGTYPYLVPPAHTRFAREVLGEGPLLAPEQGVVLEPDTTRARAIARSNLAVYTRLPNYVNAWRRSGFDEEDVTGELSDRLVDGLIARGDPEAIAARVRAHVDAGADHVCIQVVSETTEAFHRAAWRTLAGVLLDV